MRATDQNCSLTLISLALALVTATGIAIAQQPATGRITGRVVDAATGAPVAGAQVQLEGTVGGVAIAAVTEWSGRYLLVGVVPGFRSVTVRMIGYRAKTVAEVAVREGVVTPLDITLDAAAVELEGVVVSVEAERGSVSRALDEQRTASRIINAVTAEQIRKSPDGDAGQAIQRVSGVTVQDGKYVLVRGLGERYTATTLNGTRLPSPEPERKVVPLDLFPSGLLESITTTKTFTPDQRGDFSGAEVDLKTREFMTGRVWTLSTSVGGNDAATGERLVLAPALGADWLGFAGDQRRMPAPIRNAGMLAGKSQAELNQIAASFRNVWSPRAADGPPSGGFSTSLGGEDPLFGHPVTYVASFTYSFGLEVKDGERRALAAPSPSGGVEAQNASRGASGRASVLWGGMLNLSTRVGETGRLALNNTLTQSGENEATHLAGHNEQFNQILDVTRLAFTERRVRSHQLLGQHLAGRRAQLDWSVTASAVRRLEPDRSDLAYQTVIDSATGESHPYAWFGGTRSATKTYSDVAETAWEVDANYRLPLGEGRSAVKVGAYYKTTVRDADTRAYDLVAAPTLSAEQRRQPAEALFNGTYALEGRFLLVPNAALGTYRAGDRVAAGYVQGEVALSQVLRLVGGARVEHAAIDVTTRTLGLQDTTATLGNTDVLPSLAVQLRMSERHNLRLSLSQTLSRPEYRELSPTPYFDILGGQTLRGNPGLKRALIQNLDARWEWYPAAGQVVSLALFGKRFDHPVERILVQRSDGNTPEATFVNAHGASNYGVELELRRHLDFIAPALLPLTVSANATLMRSDIEPGNDSLSSLTSARRPMVGQAEYVVNAGLSYSSLRGRFSATVLYNVVGRRIVEAAIQPLPDAYEEARHLVDASLQLAVAGAVALKLDAKNLLNAPYRLTQGPVERLFYRAGRAFSVGLTWTP